MISFFLRVFVCSIWNHPLLRLYIILNIIADWDNNNIRVMCPKQSPSL